jgi:hypothetical protein
VLWSVGQTNHEGMANRVGCRRRLALGLHSHRSLGIGVLTLQLNREGRNNGYQKLGSVPVILIAQGLPKSIVSSPIRIRPRIPLVHATI